MSWVTGSSGERWRPEAERSNVAAMTFRIPLLVLGLAACGGSASESPWPAEPLDLEPGPVGEDSTRPAVDTSDLDNYGAGGAASQSEPAEPLDEEP